MAQRSGEGLLKADLGVNLEPLQTEIQNPEPEQQVPLEQRGAALSALRGGSHRRDSSAWIMSQEGRTPINPSAQPGTLNPESHVPPRLESVD